MLVLQATNAGVRGPGYEAINIVYTYGNVKVGVDVIEVELIEDVLS